MKRFFLFLAALAGVLTACNSENSAKKTTDSAAILTQDTAAATDQPISSGLACYSYTRDRDTVTMKLNVAGEEYTGSLNYRLFEKDRNSGTFAGEMKGDTLIAEYTFDSEGMRSVREVVFLKKNGQFHEGFGETVEKGSKVLYKDRSKLDFGNAIVLTGVPCE